jgi:hypothetical protein
MWARVMFPNFASIMPQAVATWCEQAGHEVVLICYTGFENLSEELPQNVDVVFVGAFSHAAQLAYALSNLFRSKGAVTVLGGPHARSYPQDARKYFDYVLGFTDQAVIRDVLHDRSPHRPEGLYLSAKQQPEALPGVRERWKFISSTLEKAPLFKIVPMLGSLGCPYTCNFCIDSVVPYQPLSSDLLREDLRFLLTKFKRPRVGWHDPNFGVRFDDCLGAIEEAVPPGSIDFFAESSLSLLSESRLKRLQRNGFKAILPGVESWFDMGNKSKTGKRNGMDKVLQVSEHINLVLKYIPYLQANFVLGLDVDEGPEPFELTKRFVDLAPGAYPAYCLLSSFGEAAPLNEAYRQANRVLPFPFHFLNTQHAMNVKPKNYTWPEFYDYAVDLTRYTFSWRAIVNRHRSIGRSAWRWMNVLRARSTQGVGRAKYFMEVRRRLGTDQEFRDFFEQETTTIPRFFVDWVRRDLGPLWKWLPAGALEHDPNAVLNGDRIALSRDVPSSEPAVPSTVASSTPSANA